MTPPLVIERSRSLLRVTGRDPVKMVHGLATADIEATTRRQGAYTAFLTPKGRMVADARVFRVDDDVLLLDTAPDARAALEEHLRKFVPPLFARAEDVSDGWAVIGVYGADAGHVVTAALPEPPERGEADRRDADRGVSVASNEPVASDEASEASEPNELVAPSEPNAPGQPEEAVVPVEGGFRARTLLTGEPGWDVFVAAERREAVIERLLEAGGRPGSPEALESLRVAAGRPRWGRELTADVIPLEAGLLDRAISQSKGCYTGQEVIVRILHRGHVNRTLRRLEFAGALPEPGTELFEGGNGKPRGVVTSAVENEVGALGLGYVRREIEPPAELRVGSPDGDPVEVTALDD